MPYATLPFADCHIFTLPPFFHRLSFSRPWWYWFFAIFRHADYFRFSMPLAIFRALLMLAYR
jgi:hypothetical protein